jgi:hypothetical protein
MPARRRLPASPNGSGQDRGLWRRDRQSCGVGSFTRQFEQVGQYQPHFFDHGRPSIGLDNETRHIIACGNPNARLGVPTGINGYRTAHGRNIGHATPLVNSLKINGVPAARAL